MFNLTVKDGLARLLLRRPEARNAIPVAGWRALAAQLGEAESLGTRLLVIAGEGGAFCAGADLGDFPELHRDAVATAGFRRDMANALNRLRELPFPTLAAIDGACFGAGTALAMACDIRIASASARFAITPGKLGISYPQEDVFRLVGLVGPGQAARLLMSAQAIDGHEAERIGLVEQCVAEELGTAVDSLASAILANSGASLATLKCAIALASSGLAQDAGQDRRFDELFGTEDFAGRLELLGKGRRR